VRNFTGLCFKNFVLFLENLCKISNGTCSSLFSWNKHSVKKLRNPCDDDCRV
jgi:hypothetical protein